MRVVFTSVISYVSRSEDYFLFLRPDRTIERDFSSNANARVTAASANCSCCFAVISWCFYDDIRINRIFFDSEEERVRPSWGIIAFTYAFFGRFLYNFCFDFMDGGLFFKSRSGYFFGIWAGRVFWMLDFGCWMLIVGCKLSDVDAYKWCLVPGAWCLVFFCLGRSIGDLVSVVNRVHSCEVLCATSDVNVLA